jgi:hypothetical protein
MIAAIVLAFALQLTPDAPAGVFGRIVDAATGIGIADAQVVVADQGLGTLTNDDGSFVLAGARGVSIEVAIVHPCFHAVRVELELAEEATPLEIGLPFNYATGQRPALDGIGACSRLYGR